MWFDPAKLTKKEGMPPAISAISAILAGNSSFTPSENSKNSENSNGAESQTEPVVTITPEPRHTLTRWLFHIGETDSELTTDFWRQVESDPAALEYFLRRAQEADEIQLGDRRKFCRMCRHSRPVYGRGEQVIRCIKQDQVWIDDWPRHCADYKPNGQPIPTVGIRWTPAPFLYNPRINP